LIFVDEEQRIRPKKGAYFVHDMIGLRVLNGEGKPFGTVKDVLHMPAHDVYVVEDAGREWMLPAVKEFVSSIDLKSGTMRVQLIEGLAD
jgi:16S rRNA processing protein RimM